MVIKSKERSTKIVNIINPGAGVHQLGCGDKSHLEKMHGISLKSSLLFIDQTNSANLVQIAPIKILTFTFILLLDDLKSICSISEHGILIYIQ